MLARFTVRPPKGDVASFGVWDNGVNGWRDSGLADQIAAEWAKSELDVQFDAYGPRPAADVRRVEPGKYVERAPDWQPAGVLDVWIRERGIWLGRTRDSDGHVAWIPGDELRETTRSTG
jgi:hypothetical protein